LFSPSPPEHWYTHKFPSWVYRGMDTFLIIWICVIKAGFAPS